MATTQPLVHMVSDEEAKGQARDLFEGIKKSTGGKVPKWMRVMANCDDVLVGFFTMYKAIMDDAPVDKMLKWKVAYRISEMNKCEFCVSISKMQLKQIGLPDDEIENIDKATNDKEKVALEYAAAATEHAYNIKPETFQKMKELFSDEQIVEITSVVGLFNFINRFNDSLGVLPDIE
ncbi:hypothetical protein KKG41_03850 [Patescibacteria group bacterium]|nr:hypothetical protein [Patescibacteria group bacterium]MBU1890658.1 hypothetical protein [Patescibacteria group bacterium]